MQGWYRWYYTRGGCHDFLDHRSAIMCLYYLYYTQLRELADPHEWVVQEWYKGGTRRGAMIFCITTDDGVRQFLRHNQRCAAHQQFRQHNVSYSSLHLTFQHSIVRICSQHNATARTENEMLCWRNSFSTHLHLTFQQIVRNFSQPNE